MRRVLIHPVSSLVLGVMLAALVALAFGLAGASRGTGAAGARAWLIGREAHSPRPVERVVYLGRDMPRGEIRIIGTEESSWDELTRWMVERPDDAASVTARLRVERSGLWAPTRVHRELQLEWVWYGEEWEGRERERAFDVVIAFLAGRAVRDERGDSRKGVMGGEGISDGEGDNPAQPSRAGAARDFAYFAGRAGVDTRVLVGGYLLNGLTAAVLVLFAISLGWVISVPRRVVRGAQGWRARRCARRGVCPRCGYSVRGLEEGRCPECGAVVDVGSDDPE